MDQKTKDILELVLYIFLGYLIAVGALRGLSYGLQTDYPAVSVITTSMEHYNPEQTYVSWMEKNGHSREELNSFPFPSGLRRGDLIIVVGTQFEKIKTGDVIVYKVGSGNPIIHRVVQKNETYLYTKGDNNNLMDQTGNIIAPPITEQYYKGRAAIHMPLLGYVKVAIMKMTGGL